jgi:hypothetical protein
MKEIISDIVKTVAEETLAEEYDWNENSAGTLKASSNSLRGSSLISDSPGKRPEIYSLVCPP